MTPANLRDLLNQHFNEAELRQLCFDLTLEYENLPGDTRLTKAQSLVQHCLRHNRLPELASRCRELRPTVSWPDVAELADEWAKIQAVIAAQEGLQSILTADQLATILTPLRQKEADLLSQLGVPIPGPTAITDSGAVAQGDNAVAVGERGVNVGGDVGLGITGDGNIIIIAAEVAAKYLQQIAPQRLSDKSLRQATGQYLENLLTRYRFLDFKGMGVNDRIPLRLPLIQMYVPLKARIELPRGDTWARQLRLAGREISSEEATAMGERLSDPLPLLDLLAKQDGLIILGDPGAGKTTFLKYLALRLALGQGEAVHLAGRLPVLLPLSAYAIALAKQDVPLDQFIGQYYRSLGVKLPLDLILDTGLQQGGVLFLLDGLDEVKNTGTRKLVVDRVVAFYAEHRQAGNKFVLTSRIVGYREVRPTADGLAECTLVDFDDDEITQFVKQWTKAVEIAAHGEGVVAEIEAQHERDDLLDAVTHNSGVRRLAANPLLLTILALMKRQGVALPKRRVELYQNYVETLLQHWNLARGLDRPPSRDLDVMETMRVLAPLALWMHETSPGVGLVKREALKRELVAIYQKRNQPKPEQAAVQFLKDVREHAGLLVERGPGQFGFIHLTFQEYMSGVAIAQKGQSELSPVAMALAENIADDNWHEVSLLAIGYLGLVQQRDEAAGEVLKKVMQAAPGEPGMAVILAGESVLDTWPGGVTPACRDDVIAAMLAAMTDEQVALFRRAKAGQILAELDDPRPGVGFVLRDGVKLPDIVWGEEVPAGRHHYQNGRIEIANPYRLSRYPITYAQFQCFVEAKDFANGRWWAGMPTGEKEIRPQRFRFANHPRDTVSWYQAMAFCRWLSDKLGETITLPHEYEWEVAARYPDGRAYPWGNTFDKNRANTDEGKLNQTTAVGLYPSGKNAALDLYDLSGNIWEWCRNKYYNPDEDAVDDSGTSRVLRGGSWFNARVNARAASRYNIDPGHRLDYNGFRVVVVRFSPSHQGH